MAENINLGLENIEPIYKSKDGQIITKSQLASSGYSERDIEDGINGKILSLIGDTNQPDQEYITKEKQKYTTKDLLENGYTQSDIDKGILDGFISPIEKKNQVASTALPKEPSVGVSDGTISTTTTEKPAIAPLEEKPTDLISQVLEMKRLSEEGDVSISGRTEAAQAVFTPNAESRRKAESIKKELKDKYKVDAEDLYEKIKDLPKEAYEWEVRKKDGTKGRPYTKENLAKMYMEDPYRFDSFINGFKNRILLKKSISELPKEEMIAKGISPISVINEYNDLNEANNFLTWKNNNLERQKEIINTYIPNLEDRKIALNRLEANVSTNLNSNNPDLIDEYNASPLKDKLDVNQYAALQLKKIFHPDEYNQAINFLEAKPTPMYTTESGRGVGLKPGKGMVESERYVDQKIAKESILKDLSDKGKSDALNALYWEQSNLAKSLESLPEDQRTPLIEKYNKNILDIDKIVKENEDTKKDIDQNLGVYKNQYIEKYNRNVNKLQSLLNENEGIGNKLKSLPEDNRNELLAKYNDTIGKINEMKSDYDKDAEKYPLLTKLKYDKQVKDFMQQSGFSAMGYAGKKFIQGFVNTAGALDNIVASLSDKKSNIANQMIKLGQKKIEENDFYLPEAYQGTGGLFLTKFDKKLANQINAITKGRDLSDLTESESAQVKNILSQNQNLISTITNPNAGKSKNFFSLATLYSNAGMLGDIGSFAVQTGLLSALGAPSALAQAIPLYTTSQNDFYKEAVAKGMSDPDGYANAHAAIMFLAGFISPKLDSVKKIVGLNSKAGQLLAGVSEETWNAVINKNKSLLNRITNSLKTTALESGKEIGKMGLVFGAGTSVAGDLINKHMYNEGVSYNQMLDNAVESTKHLVISSTGMLGFGALSRLVKGVSTLEKSSLWQLSDDKATNLLRVDEAVKDGKITLEQGNARKKIINDANEIIEKMPNKNAKGELMTDKERLDYFYNLLIKKRANEDKSTLPKAQQEKVNYSDMVLDHSNNLIIEPKTQEELDKRKKELEDKLIPKKDKEGKEIEIDKDEELDTKAELEAINSHLDDLIKKKEPIKSTNEILGGKEAELPEAKPIYKIGDKEVSKQEMIDFVESGKAKESTEPLFVEGDTEVEGMVKGLGGEVVEKVAELPKAEEKPIEAKKAELEQKLKNLDERDARSLEAITPNNPNHPTIKVGMKMNDGLNVIVEKTNTDNWNGEGEGYTIITAVKSPAEFDSNGKMTKAAKIEEAVFNSKEEADAAVQATFESVKSKMGKAQQKVKQELAALEKGEEVPQVPKAEETAIETTPIENPKVVITGTRRGMENLGSANYDPKIDAKIQDARGRQFDENGILIEKDDKGNQIVHIKVEATDAVNREGYLQISVIVPEGTKINNESIKKIVDAEVEKIKAKDNEYLHLNEVQESDFTALRDAVVNELKNPSVEKVKVGEEVPQVPKAEEKTKEIADAKADIERRRQEELVGLRGKEGQIIINEETKKRVQEIKAKYDAELKALKEKQTVGEEVPQAELPKAEEAEAGSVGVGGDVESNTNERVVYDREPTADDGVYKILGDERNVIYRVNPNTGRIQEYSDGLWSNTASNAIARGTARTQGFQKIKDPSKSGQSLKVTPKAEAELPPTPEKATPKVEEEITPKINKDTKTEFTTKSGKQKINKVNGELIVTDAKTGKRVSKPTERKAIKEWEENFNFSEGEMASEFSGYGGTSQETAYAEHVIETSENPLEIAQIFIGEEYEPTKLSTTEALIAELGIGKITNKSFQRFGDRNLITLSLARAYLNNQKGKSIDVIAKEMSDHYEYEITPQDIVDFMVKFPNGVKDALKMSETEVAQNAYAKFKKLTGLDLTRPLAERLIQKEFDKLSSEQQKLLNQDYERANQLESEYWKAYEETDGFTKESTVSEVKPTVEAKPKEPTAEKVEPKAEVPKEEKAGRFEQQARKIAEKISKAELPDFMKTPEFLKDAKKSGMSAEDLQKKLAEAVIQMGKLLDKGVEYSKAIKEAVSELVGISGESSRENVEKGFEDYYKGLTEEEGAIPPTEKENKNQSPEWDDNMTKVANAINDAYIEGKFGIEALDSVLAKLQDTDIKTIYEAVKKDIKGGKIKVKEVREKVTATKSGSERDQAVLLYDLAELKGKEDQIQKAIIEETDSDKKIKLQQDLLDVQNEMLDNALANRMIGRTASNIFRIRQVWVNRDADLAQMTQQYKASKGAKELTPEQEKEIKTAYNAIREAKAKANKLKQELNEALEREEKAKKEIELLKKIESQSKEIKKKERAVKSSEKIQASKQRIQDAKDKLRQLRSGMNDITRVLPETALQISKIAAEKFYQGVVKFDELVKNVYDEVKDVFPEWTEKDVRKHLLPEIDIEAYYENREVVPKTAEDVKLKLNEYQRAQAEYAKLMFDWQKNRSSDIMEKKPFKDRLLDKILRWQRFAVLSYPSTMVKLGAVVAHQLTLKPLKFATQYLQNLILKGISPEAAKKQQIFGTPSLKALAKYYSEFIRNFSAQNLKEQFSGIDTKEILYGKKFMYDEWAAGKGLLEIPGRSHGYVKSFVKNPEFAFAHEQLTSWHLNKMAEIEKELKNTSLTAERKAQLEEEYKQNDITNDEVLDKINSQSLAHSKWAIMMNDNKFVDKFRNFSKSVGGIGGAVIQSEMPIVKIPTNYVGRVFAMKYGLIEAVIGKKGEKGYPGIVNIIRKGASKLTSEQADLLGKTLTLGSMGASFFLIGYMNSNNIKENEDGSYNIFGVNVSKNLIHSPEIESILNGAVLGNKYKRGDGFIKSWVEADFDIIKKNPFINMLTYGFLPNVAIALTKKRGEDKAADKITDAAAKKITDMTVPGFVKQIAQWSDVKEGGFKPTGEVVPRVPKGTNLERALQRFELAIPGLRQQVPESYFKIEEKFKKEPGVKMLLDSGLELPDLPKIEDIKVNKDDRHPKGEMTKEDAKEYSEVWSKNLITALNQVEVMLKKSNIKPTQEQLEKIVGLAKENATQNAKTIMIDKGRFEEREKEEPVDFMEEIKEMIKEIEP